MISNIQYISIFPSSLDQFVSACLDDATEAVNCEDAHPDTHMYIMNQSQ